MQFK